MKLAYSSNIEAFVLAAELGSFSAAARRMGKAQSAVSTAIANLEIDAGITLFDRSGRNPVPTEAGRALLPYAKGIVVGNREFVAKARSMGEGVEARLCLAIEQAISITPLMNILQDFSAEFAHVALEVLMPGPNDTATLLKEGRADIGLMIEQESYPTGFQFRGVGHSKLVPVCARNHPLADLQQVRHHELRRYRQLIPRSRSLEAPGHLGERKSAMVWYADNPALIADLVCEGFGWAELPLSLIAEALESGRLVQISYAFQQSDILEGIDVVWTDRHALGLAGQWIRDRLLGLPQNVWRES
ncbi:MAG: LysR family transcriptional regulator [Rhizobiaceae bacterium]